MSRHVRRAGLGGAAPQDRKDSGSERRPNSKEEDAPLSERFGALWVKVREGRQDYYAGDDPKYRSH